MLNYNNKPLPNLPISIWANNNPTYVINPPLSRWEQGVREMDKIYADTMNFLWKLYTNNLSKITDLMAAIYTNFASVVTTPNGTANDSQLKTTIESKFSSYFDTLFTTALNYTPQDTTRLQLDQVTDTVSTLIDIMTYAVTYYRQQQTDIQAEIDTLNTNIAALNTQISINNTNYSALDTTISANATQRTTHEGQTGANDVHSSTATPTANRIAHYNASSVLQSTGTTSVSNHTVSMAQVKTYADSRGYTFKT